MFHFAELAYSDTVTGDVWAYIAAFFLFFVLFVLIFLFFYCIPSTICTWILFKKAGKAGWAALIPFYNLYVFGVISKKPMWMVWVALGFYIATYIPGLNLGGIVLLVFFVILLLGFIEQYRADVFFWLGYIFLPIVAVFFVKKIEYIGGDSTMNSSPMGMNNPMAPITPQTPVQYPQYPPQYSPQYPAAQPMSTPAPTPTAPTSIQPTAPTMAQYPQYTTTPPTTPFVQPATPPFQQQQPYTAPMPSVQPVVPQDQPTPPSNTPTSL